jgi:N-acetylglutamate synthase-like GNAT family acetyltransferase
MTQENRELRLRAARIDELAALTELCLRSKAVWGYDEAFMRACRTELALAPRDLQTSRIQIAERDGKIIGVAQIAVAGTGASLEKLFVEPDILRSGAGRRLFEWAAAAAREQGARTLTIEADPEPHPSTGAWVRGTTVLRRQGLSPAACCRASSSTSKVVP